MSHEEYQTLLRLLCQLRVDEKARIEANHKGSLYWDFVEEEIFAPMGKIIELVRERVQQTAPRSVP